MRYHPYWSRGNVTLLVGGGSAGVGVLARGGNQAGDDLAELARLPACALVLRRAGDPALGDGHVAALDVEHAAGDVARLGAAEPDHERRDVRRVARVPLRFLVVALPA